MKKGELTKIIERAVRKEVKKQMNEIFIKEDNSSQLSELVSKTVTEKEFKEPIRKQPKPEPKQTSTWKMEKVEEPVVKEVVVEQEQKLKCIPLKKFVDPAHVAQLAHFLISDKSQSITGQNFIIDGGQSILGEDSHIL